VINNGTAILAELNGLRPLMGPGDAPTLGHHLTPEQIAEEEQRLHENAGHQTVATTAVTVDVTSTQAPTTNGKAPENGSAIPTEVHHTNGQSPTEVTPAKLVETNSHTNSANGKVFEEMASVTLAETNGYNESSHGSDDEEETLHLPAPLGMLRQADLAKRLGVPTQTLTSQRLKDDFTAWSKSKDPEGIAWFYEPATKCFYTIEVEHHLQGMEPDEAPVNASEDDLTTVEV